MVLKNLGLVFLKTKTDLILGFLTKAVTHVQLVTTPAKCRKLVFELGIPLVDIYSTLCIITDLENDMIHINSKGRQKIADAVWSGIFIQSTPKA